MGRIWRTRQATLDLVDIALYIGNDNADAALRVLDLLEERFQLLAANPLLGELRTDLQPGLRSLVVKNYVVFYQPDHQDITLVRILHSARDVGPLFP